MSAAKKQTSRLDLLRSGVTGTLSLIATALGVVFLLIPSLRPLSRDKIDASVEIATVEQGVSLKRWAQRQYGRGRADDELRKLLGPKGVNKFTLSAPGSVVYVRLRTDGFKRRSIQRSTAP